jgi:hypothetical protein
MQKDSIYAKNWRQLAFLLGATQKPEDFTLYGVLSQDIYFFTQHNLLLSDYSIKHFNLDN